MLPFPENEPDVMAESPMEPTLSPMGGIDNLFPVEPVTHSPPLTLSVEEQNRLKEAVRQALDAARSARSEIDDKIRRIKKFVRLSGKREVKGASGSAPYEGVPNVLTSLTASRMDAVRANVERTFFRSRPFFSAIPETAKGQRSVRAWEAFMEAELRRTDSAVEIKKAIHQAVDLHAGIIAMDVEPEGNDFRVFLRAVDIESFYIYPTASNSVSMAGATFELLRLPVWRIRELGAEGFFDAAAVESLVTSGEEATPTPAQEMVGSTGGSGGTQDWSLIQLWLTWIRWEGSLWRVYWTEGGIILRAEENFLPINRPPYENLNTLLEIDSFYSMPLAQLIESYQDVVDSLYNSILAEAQFTIAPPMIMRDSTLMADMQAKGWAPGMQYQGNMLLDEANFRQVPTRLNIAAQELLILTNNFAEGALPSVPSVPVGGRKTRFEVSVFAEAGSDRLGVLIGNIALGLRRLAETYWELLRYYRVNRIRTVYRYSDSVTRPSEMLLIGPNDQEIVLPDSVATQDRNEGVIQFLIMQGIPPAIATAIVDMLPPEMDKLLIHSAYRDDVYWQATGGDTLPERIARQQALQVALATAPIITAARQDRGLWHLLQKLYKNAGLSDWIDILGPAPDKFDDVAIQQAMQIFGGMVNNQAMAGLLQGPTGPTEG